MAGRAADGEAAADRFCTVLQAAKPGSRGQPTATDCAQQRLVDPTIVSRLLHRSRASPLDDLPDRERDVLALIAEGRSNNGISDRLYLSPKTVDGRVKHIFQKLDIADSADHHRRVLTVDRHLRTTDN
jgi:DNA-binding NarL/FixJ family response regulator